MLKIKLIFFSIVFYLFLFFFSTAVSATRMSPLIIDHRSVMDFDGIPAGEISSAKNLFSIGYGRTSHGSQLETGMSQLSNTNSLYNYNSNFLTRISGASDLGNPNRTLWASATRNFLNSNPQRNIIMWSWCYQVCTASESDINTYLDLMNNLENDYPDTTFIYMTGFHLPYGYSREINGETCTGNDLQVRNQQIRDYAIANNKILYDFADIDSHDPNGTYYPNETDACSWCSSWCSSHSCPSCGDCSHSHCFNCYQKGKAFWYMMAKLAGWEDGGTPTTTPVPTTTLILTPTNTPQPTDPTSPPLSCTPPRHFGNALRANGACDNDINMSDYATWFREFFNNEATLYADFNRDNVVNRDDLPQWINKCYETGYGCAL